MSRLLSVKQNKGFFSEVFLGGCSVFTFTYYLKHTFLLNYYKEYTTLNGNDGVINPSDRLMSLVSTVQQDVKHLTSENTPIIPYIVPGLRILNAGTLGTIQGGIIGLPQYFEFNNQGDVDDKIKKADSSMDENVLEEIYDCFLLSDKAKKYGIARGILCVNTLQVYIEMFVPIGISLLVNVICTSVPTNIYSNFIYRGVFYALVIVVGISIWRKVHSLTKNYFESHIEEDLAALGHEYVEGAIEFYSKALNIRHLNLEWKNQNSRVLSNISDRINSITSRKEIPLNYRLAFYKSKLNVDTTNNDHAK